MGAAESAETEGRQEHTQQSEEVSRPTVDRVRPSTITEVSSTNPAILVSDSASASPVRPAVKKETSTEEKREESEEQHTQPNHLNRKLGVIAPLQSSTIAGVVGSTNNRVSSTSVTPTSEFLNTSQTLGSSGRFSSMQNRSSSTIEKPTTAKGWCDLLTRAMEAEKEATDEVLSNTSQISSAMVSTSATSSGVSPIPVGDGSSRKSGLPAVLGHHRGSASSLSAAGPENSLNVDLADLAERAEREEEDAAKKRSVGDRGRMTEPAPELLPDGLSPTECAYRAVRLDPSYAIAWRQLGYFLGVAKARHGNSSGTVSPAPQQSFDSSGGAIPSPITRRNYESSATVVTIDHRVYDPYKCYLTSLHLDPEDPVTWKYASAALCPGEYYEVSKIPPCCQYLFKIEALVQRRKRGDDATVFNPHLICDATLCLVIAISLDADCGSAWSRLGTHLLRNSHASTFVGSVLYSQPTGLIKDIPREDGTDERVKAVQVFGGTAFSTFVTPRDCFLRAVESDAFNQGGWNGLGAMLRDPETIKVKVNKGGQVETLRAHQCFIRALEIEPNFAGCWYNLGCALRDMQRNDSFPTPVSSSASGYTGSNYGSRESLHSEESNDFCGVTDPVTRKVSPAVKVNGYPYTQVRCLAMAIELNEHHANAWAELGTVLAAAEEGQRTAVVGDSFVNPTDCFKAALCQNPKDAAAWEGLGASLPDSTVVELRGMNFSKPHCFKNAVKLCPEFPRAWSQLADQLAKGEKELLLPQEELQRKGKVTGPGQAQAPPGTLTPVARNKRYEDNNDPAASSSTSARKKKKEPVWVPTPATIMIDGLEYNPRACYVKALEHNLKSASGWWNVARTIPRGSEEKVKVGNKEFSKVDCHVQAINVNPTFWASYHSLGVLLPANGQAIIKDPDQPANTLTLTKVDCLAKFLAQEPENDLAWFNLGSCMVPGQSVVVAGLGKFTNMSALAKSVELQPSASAWANLGSMLGNQKVAIRVPRDDPLSSPTLGPSSSSPVQRGPPPSTYPYLNASRPPVGASFEALRVGIVIEVTAKDCFVRAIRMKPDMLQAWINLSFNLAATPRSCDERDNSSTVDDPGLVTVIPGREPLNKLQCLQRSLELCLVGSPGGGVIDPKDPLKLQLAERIQTELCNILYLGDKIKVLQEGSSGGGRGTSSSGKRSSKSSSGVVGGGGQRCVLTLEKKIGWTMSMYLDVVETTSSEAIIQEVDSLSHRWKQ